MGNVIIIAVIMIILAAASYKIYKDKKNNVKCSGCPSYRADGGCSAYKSEHKSLI